MEAPQPDASDTIARKEAVVEAGDTKIQDVPSIVISNEQGLIDTPETSPAPDTVTQQPSPPTQDGNTTNAIVDPDASVPSGIDSVPAPSSTGPTGNSESGVPTTPLEAAAATVTANAAPTSPSHKEESETSLNNTIPAFPNGAPEAVSPSLSTDTTLQGPVIDFYRNKNILLTGSTGFIGKSILWKLIHSLGNSVGRIYLLVRNGNTKRSKMGLPNDRIKNEILNNKVSSKEEDRDRMYRR